MMSASITSANEPAKDLIFDHTVQLKPMIEHISQEEWYLVVWLCSNRLSTHWENPSEEVDDEIINIIITRADRHAK